MDLITTSSLFLGEHFQLLLTLEAQHATGTSVQPTGVCLCPSGSILRTIPGADCTGSVQDGIGRMGSHFNMNIVKVPEDVGVFKNMNPYIDTKNKCFYVYDKQPAMSQDLDVQSLHLRRRRSWHQSCESCFVRYLCWSLSPRCMRPYSRTQAHLPEPRRHSY